MHEGGEGGRKGDGGAKGVLFVNKGVRGMGMWRWGDCR